MPPIPRPAFSRARMRVTRTASAFILACLAFSFACAPALARHDPAHAAQDPELRSAAPEAPPLASPVTVAIDDATRSPLPRHAAEASAHGQTLRCEGVAMADLLRKAGVLPDGGLRGAALTRYMLVTARDGYRAVFSLAELDPSLGNTRLLLVDRCDGQTLDDEAGPLRLIAPADSRPARWVRQVEAITVIVAP